MQIFGELSRKIAGNSRNSKESRIAARNSAKKGDTRLEFPSRVFGFFRKKPRLWTAPLRGLEGAGPIDTGARRQDGARPAVCAASTRALPPSFFFHIEQNSQLLRRLCDAWNVLILFQQVNNSDLDLLIMNYIVVDTIYTTNEGEKKLGDMSALNSLVPSSEREQLR